MTVSRETLSKIDTYLAQRDSIPYTDLVHFVRSLVKNIDQEDELVLVEHIAYLQNRGRIEMDSFTGTIITNGFWKSYLGD